jgi:uncharacterized membrane protein YbhN (UPF0104 family)
MLRAVMRRLTSVLPPAVGLAVLGGLCWRYGLGQLASALHRLSPGTLLVYLLLGVLVRVGYCLRWGLVTRALGGSVPLLRRLRARVAGDAVGALVPSGKLAGEPVRVAMVYAKGLAGAEATAGVTIDRLLELSGNLLCAVAYVAVFAFAHTLREPDRTLPFMLAVTLSALAALLVPLVMLHRGRRPLAPIYAWRGLPKPLVSWVDGIRQTEDHLLRFFGEHRRTFLWGLGSSLAIELIVIGEHFCLLAAFGVILNLPTLLLVLLGTGLARAVPTPAGLGALEASSVAVLGLVAGQPQTGFLIGLLLRLHETLWLVVGLVAMSVETQALVAWRRLRAVERL